MVRIMMLVTLAAVGSAEYLDKLGEEPMGMSNLTVARGMLFGVEGAGGAAFSLSDMEVHPVTLTFAFEWELHTDVNKIWVDGDSGTILAAQGASGMGTYKLEDDRVENGGTFKLRKTDGVATNVARYKSYAYLFLHTKIPHPQASVVIVDVSDLTNPFSLTKMDLEGRVIASLISERTLYAVTRAGRVYAWDITKPKIWSPLFKIIIGTADEPLEGTCITQFKDFIYVGAGTEVYMYLLVEGEKPVYVSKHDCASKVNDIVWFRGFLYVATAKGLHVVRVTDPAFPVPWGFRETATPAVSLTIIEFTAMVATPGGLLVIDALPPLEQEVPLYVKLDEFEKGRVPVVKKTLPPRTPVPTPEPTDEREETSAPAVCGCSIRNANSVSELRQRETYDGAKLWASVIGSKLVGVPPWLVGADLYTPNTLPVPTMAEIEFACCSAVCELFVILDHCSDCVSYASGGLLEVLLSEGWSVSYCSPQISPATEATPIPTVSFRKRIFRSEVQTLSPLPRPLMLAAFAVVERDSLCVEIDEQPLCQANSFCSWSVKEERCFPTIDRCDV